MKFPVTHHNLNDQMRIKPLKRGLEIIARERDELRKQLPDTDWTTWMRPDADGYLELPAWQVMSVFGYACYMGPEPPFETEFTLEQSDRTASAAGEKQ